MSPAHFFLVVVPSSIHYRVSGISCRSTTFSSSIGVGLVLEERGKFVGAAARDLGLTESLKKLREGESVRWGERKMSLVAEPKRSRKPRRL